MPRQLRIEFPGAFYHVMSRGDRREDIFLDDNDRHLFLKTLEETCAKTQFQVHAWCLMRNHFHLVLQTPQANLVAGMKWLLSTYTARFNRKNKVFGHLFSGRYKAILISRSPGYLRTACHYVHLNPVRARLLPADRPLSSYPWSSYPAYLKSPRVRPGWLRTDLLFGELHLHPETSARRRRFEEHMEQWRAGEEERDYKPFRRGWVFGEEEFKEEMLEFVAENKSPTHQGEEIFASEVHRADKLIRNLLAREKWSEADLRSSRKGHPAKIRIARQLREQTTMTVAWISERLQMGTPAHLRHLLYWSKRGKKRLSDEQSKRKKARKR